MPEPTKEEQQRYFTYYGAVCANCGKKGYTNGYGELLLIGRPLRCKECYKKRQLEKAAHHRSTPKAKETARSWRSQNKEKVSRYSQEMNSRRAVWIEEAGDKFTQDQWNKLLSFYCPDGKCLACGQTNPLTADHVVPLCSGGNNGINNIQPLCRVCNSKKSDKTIDYRPDQGEFARLIA